MFCKFLCSAEPTLPKGHSLSSSNRSRNWRSLSTPPFKDMDLNKLMRNWIPNSRIPKNNHYVLCIDFLRFYFAQACNPCEAVKEFACRLSGKGGKSCLLDLPEAITSHLVDFVLDGFGLGIQDLDMSVEALIKNPT
ncbi:unnamed protein product [Heligmosomoides polygyrus]|uniref:NPH3 domain-containing protein n=1 Tax=Heligmosomoides polygyrus TaxID=6339 RepID=A0A183GWD0_HELPZ|nr:unnamed protein product [Heligmosomoides polygyrus]